jgi:N-acetylneuraminate synthase/N,N'-diacetyllegionaminate synthase
LRKIPALAAAFGCPIGFSDHTEGVTAALGAVALGACLIEKHFTLDRDLPGPDHRFSSNPAEFRALVDGVRTLERNLGASTLGPTESEAFGRENFRLSCVAARAVNAGQLLTQADITYRRPGNGFPPKAAEWLAGLRLARAVPAGATFSAADFADSRP